MVRNLKWHPSLGKFQHICTEKKLKAAKNASSLLEELDREKNMEESKKAAAARKREKKKRKKSKMIET